VQPHGTKGSLRLRRAAWAVAWLSTASRLGGDAPVSAFRGEAETFRSIKVLRLVTLSGPSLGISAWLECFITLCPTVTVGPLFMPKKTCSQMERLARHPGRCEEQIGARNTAHDKSRDAVTWKRHANGYASNPVCRSQTQKPSTLP
jgi:hypothetical protein